MFRLSGGSRDVFPPSTVAPGWVTRESSVLSRALGHSCEQMCAKLYVLITKIYGIAGVVNILLDATFSCVIMWIYVFTRMCWRIIT